MKIVVIGLGNFGINIAKTLIKNNCEVLGVDTSQETIESIKDTISYAVTGNAANKEVLESLNITDYDAAIIGVGQDMASSILISLYLKELGLKKVIARAISEDHSKILYQLGITEVIFPEKDTAIKIANKLSLKNAIDFMPISDEFGIVEVATPASFTGKNLAKLKISTRFKCQVIGIKYRNIQSKKEHDESIVTKVAPTATDILIPDSTMIVLGKIEDIEKLQDQK